MSCNHSIFLDSFINNVLVNIHKVNLPICYILFITDENQISFYPGIKEGTKLTLVKKSPQPTKCKSVHTFKEEMIKVLRNYYSEADALTIANQTIKDLQTKVNLLSFDDLERLATALVQDQENIS